MSETTEKQIVKKFQIPEEVTEATQTDPKDLVIVSIPKMGKGTILGDFTRDRNAIVFDLEKGGYEYISARKMSIYPNDETNLGEAFDNYITMRKALSEVKGKFDYLIIDGLSDLDLLSDLGGTLMYMNSIVGKKFNRDKDGDKLKWGDPEFKSVLNLPDGGGYNYTRKWFLDQIEIFKQISPYRIYAAHIKDKYVRDNGKEDVVGAEISLTGMLKTIFASKVTSLAKLVAEGNKRYLNFDVANDSVIAGSRNPLLKGRILISEQDDNGKTTTFWDSIYKNKK